MNSDLIDNWLKTARIINQFCTQNGWIDSDSLRYEVRSIHDGQLNINVYFTEILMEGAGCVAGHVSCFGQLAVQTDPAGQVVHAEVV